MKTPLPPIRETPQALNALLSAEHDAQTHPRLQARSLLQTQQARPRRQVAPRLGLSRETVGRWLAAQAPGGLLLRLTMAKAPGNTPRLAPQVQQALRQRLAHPAGCARYKALWPWRRQAYGLSLAYQTVQKVVRYT